MELFACRLNLDDKPLGKRELMAAVGEADVLVPTVTDRIDAAVLAASGPGLKLIASYGTGIDHVDLAAALQRGIMVSNTPGCPRRGHRRYGDGADPRGAAPPGRGREADPQRRLAAAGARPRCSAAASPASASASSGSAASAAPSPAAPGASGSRVHYHNRRRLQADIEAELEATYWESLDQMLAHIDILSVNVPHTPSTFHLLNARRLKLMKPHAYHRQHRPRRGRSTRTRLTRMLRARRHRRRRSRRLRARATTSTRGCAS